MARADPYGYYGETPEMSGWGEPEQATRDDAACVQRRLPTAHQCLRIWRDSPTGGIYATQ